MADTKISALTTDSSPDRTADYSPTYDASATATKKVLLSNYGGILYTVVFSLNLSPADATTYYFSPYHTVGLVTSVTSHKTWIQRAGLITRIEIQGSCTVGSSETSTISFRLNDTTDTTISSTLAFNATPVHVVNSALSVAVASTDYFNIKWVSPTWVTNPTNVNIIAQIWQT